MEVNISSEVKWVKLNAGVTGYYVVNYDKDGWKKIITQLKVDHKVVNKLNINKKGI